MQVVAIFNPKAGKGKPLGIPAAAQLLVTEAPRHATELARNAIKAGAQTIIAIGGDGTIHEVVNGFFENEELIAGGVTLQIIPHGTGSDFSRILARHRGEPLMIDLLKVRYTNMQGLPDLCYCINVTSFGMGAVVADQMNRSSKPLGGRFAFMAATLRTAVKSGGHSITVQLDGAKTIDRRITHVAVGNGQYHGAGMWVCPGAAVDDGLIDVTVIPHLPPLQIVKNLPLLYNGGILSHPDVEAYRVKRLKADSPETVLIEIDGEPAGRLPAEISILPKTMRVLVS